MEKIAICPNCNTRINHLNYKEEGYERTIENYTASGHCSLERDNREEDDRKYENSDYGDSEIDSRDYICPECNERIENIDDLEFINQPQKRKTKKKVQQIIYSSSNLIYGNAKRNNNYGLHFLVCAKCNTNVEIINDENNKDHNEEEVTCTRCGQTITKETAKKIINQ